MNAVTRNRWTRWLTGLSGQRSDVFSRLMVVSAALAGIVHLCFIALFDSAGVHVLAQANVASVLVYAAAAWFTLQGRGDVAMWLMASEILLHGWAATALIGWGSGFHSYIVITIPVAIVSTFYRPAVKAALALALGLFYVALDVRYRQAVPPVEVPAHLLTGLHHFNQGATLLILGLLATVYYRMVASAEAGLRELACTDPLTQLRNRRFALEVAQHEAAVFQRGGRPLAVIVCDVDHFKHINDVHGHAVGDTALRAIARVLRDGVREVDHVARWGGEEFLVLLPETDVDEALQVSERLRHDVQALSAGNLAGLSLRLSMTVGVAVLRADEAIEQALVRADRAMYDGKQAGRNRVVLAGHGSASAL